jgi:uncharacterized cupredoxin-like copper-binding protein
MMPRHLSPRNWLFPVALLFGLPLIVAGGGGAAAHDASTGMGGMDMSGMDMAGTHHDQPTANGFGRPFHGGQPARTVEITMNDASFTPAHLEVKAGQSVRFVVTNASGIDHDFTLGDAATQTAHRTEMAAAMQAGQQAHHHHSDNAVMVTPGATRTLSWLFTTPGSFEYDCNIPGHFEAGMRGTITVSR